MRNKHVAQTCQYIAGVLIAIIVLREFGQFFHVYGPSMLPALRAGQLVLVERVSYRFRAPRRGEIVVIYRPAQGVMAIKRVRGVADDELYGYTVPAGAVFLMGDNEDYSQDSRNYGPLDIENVVGRAVWRYWPLREWGRLQ